MIKDRVDAVGKMQDYIKSHVNDPITLKDLARSCGLSPWHASRIFKEFLDKTPFEYIRAYRLTRAALKLRDEKVKVIDVAFDFVFDTHEGFTRAFSRQFGMTPMEYKRSTPPVQLFIPYHISASCRNKLKEKENMEKKSDDTKVETVFVQVVERPARKMILKRGVRATEYFEYCEEVGCDIFSLLLSIKEALFEPVGAWLPPGMIPKGTSQYVQGVEVPPDYSGQVPEGYDIIDLEPCKMMVFQGAPFKDEEFEGAIKNLWKVMNTYNPEIYGFSWADDDAPRFQMEPQGYRGYIEGRPVREIRRGGNQAEAV